MPAGAGSTVSRLVIDARMFAYSGIGTYLQNVLPLALPRLRAFDSLVLLLPGDLAAAGARLGDAAAQRAWNVRPLSARELLRPPRDLEDAFWWVPHLNVPLRSNTPLIVTLHDLLPLHEDLAPSTLPKRLAVRAWLWAIRRRARRVLCVSHATKADAIARGGLDPSLVEVVHLGVDADWKAVATETRGSGEPYLVFVGLIKPHKNLGALLAAFEMLQDRIPHRLLIVGKHFGLRDIDTTALQQARRLAPRVELRENVRKPDLVRLVAHSDALIQPSLHEGFGLPPLEAMAAGVPVIVSGAGALAEIGGDAARYCDPRSPASIAEAILDVVSDAGLRARMRQRGLARAALFTWETCAAKTADVIARTVQEHGARNLQ